jgi:hypothetical protein
MPKNTRYHFCMNLSASTLLARRSSGNRMMMIVPSTGPKNRPEPPTITASSIINDVEKWKGPGSMNSTSDA